jgi:hypothetical protein
MAEEPNTASYYRAQAEDARQRAASAANDKFRNSYLKLAIDWDRLADGIDEAKARADEHIATLMRSMPKA